VQTLRLGEDLVIRLPENPTTGYRWEFRQSGTGALRLAQDVFEPGSREAVGAAGRREVRFVAERAGKVRVEAVERRSWEAPEAASRRQVYDVVVE
jgi:inhibitor of cysteine peptidase